MADHDVQKTKTMGWVAYLDIYAFSSYLFSPESGRCLADLTSAQRNILSEFRKLSFSNFFMFSDTVIAWMPQSSENRFRQFMDIISLVQNCFADVGFMFRGAVTFGEMELAPNFILGDAYIRAYKTQTYSIMYPQTIVSKEDILSGYIGVSHVLPCEPIATKDGSILTGHILDFLERNQTRKLIDRNISFVSTHYQGTDREKYLSFWDGFSSKSQGGAYAASA